MKSSPYKTIKLEGLASHLLQLMFIYFEKATKIKRNLQIFICNYLVGPKFWRFRHIFVTFKNAKCRGSWPQISKFVLKLSPAWIKFRFSKKGHKNLRKPEKKILSKDSKTAQLCFPRRPFLLLTINIKQYTNADIEKLDLN